VSGREMKMHMQTPKQLREQLGKLMGMTEWFSPKEIDEMQVRLNRDHLAVLRDYAANVPSGDDGPRRESN